MGEGMKTPDEIKRGLECCARLKFPNTYCDGCPYLVKAAENLWECKSPEILTDVLAYIQQLEMLAKPNEQIRWERDVAVDQLRQLGVGFGEKVEAQVPKWISVEERLPESAGLYLVAFHPCYWDDVELDRYNVGMDTFRGKSTWAKRKFQRVTHWMPLPEPPKEG